MSVRSKEWCTQFNEMWEKCAYNVCGRRLISFILKDLKASSHLEKLETAVDISLDLRSVRSPQFLVSKTNPAAHRV